jgi:hypothetical protein
MSQHVVRAWFTRWTCVGNSHVEFKLVPDPGGVGVQKTLTKDNSKHPMYVTSSTDNLVITPRNAILSHREPIHFAKTSLLRHQLARLQWKLGSVIDSQCRESNFSSV